MLWTKSAHQCAVFRLLGALRKVHTIPHTIFETTRSGFIQILHHCPVSWKIPSLYFLAQTSYTLDKNSPSKWNFWTFEWLGENSPNFSYHIWNHKLVFLFKLCITPQCHGRYVFCNFLAENLYDLYKGSPPKCKISDFRLLRWNCTKFVLWQATFVESI